MLVALSWTGGRWDLVPTHPPWGAHVGRDPCTLRGARRREPPPPSICLRVIQTAYTLDLAVTLRDILLSLASVP